ncbi:hypothetical protein D3C85_1303390 [compost metagenome]
MLIDWLCAVESPRTVPVPVFVVGKLGMDDDPPPPITFTPSASKAAAVAAPAAMLNGKGIDLKALAMASEA